MNIEETMKEIDQIIQDSRFEYHEHMAMNNASTPDEVLTAGILNLLKRQHESDKAFYEDLISETLGIIENGCRMRGETEALEVIRLQKVKVTRAKQLMQTSNPSISTGLEDNKKDQFVVLSGDMATKLQKEEHNEI